MAYAARDKKIILDESGIPARWYNIAADLPNPPPPPLHPQTRRPLDPADLAPLFPEPLIEQELSRERWIDVPGPVRELLRIWRPTPLVRADRLEKALGLGARVYFKNESVAPAGSHKSNTATAQAYFNHISGVKRLTTETGGGQWGTALAHAAQAFGLACEIYMVRVSYQQKPYRRSMMRTYGAEIISSPSERTASGRDVLAGDPDCLGSLGIAISEAIERAVADPDARYSLGSVLNHVLLHQTVVGLETREQLAAAGIRHPDILVGCCGGGSSFAGLAFPFVPDKLGGAPIRMLGVEPAACPTLTRGVYAYDYGDLARFTPLMKMYTLGSQFVPPGIHAGGLRYHGMAPLISTLVRDKIIEPLAIAQSRVFEAAAAFARAEGIVPAPESAHAVAVAIDEAKKPENAGKNVIFLLTGHGHFDMFAYDKYFDGQIEDYHLPPEMIAQAVKGLDGEAGDAL